MLPVYARTPCNAPAGATGKIDSSFLVSGGERDRPRHLRIRRFDIRAIDAAESAVLQTDTFNLKKPLNH